MANLYPPLPLPGNKICSKNKSIVNKRMSKFTNFYYISRREIIQDPLSGQKYEKYEGIFEEISNIPLDERIDDSESIYDEFDDQFEEDILDKKIMMLAKSRISESVRENEELGPDLSTSRWLIYDVFSTTLEKYIIYILTCPPLNITFVNSILCRNGFNGRMCLLRAICEATWVRFSKSNLMGELFHIFFT